jgi:hypothetical protein
MSLNLKYVFLRIDGWKRMGMADAIDLALLCTSSINTVLSSSRLLLPVLT